MWLFYVEKLLFFSGMFLHPLFSTLILELAVRATGNTFLFQPSLENLILVYPFPV